MAHDPGACGLCLLSSSLPLAQARLGVQVPRCPGAQAQATPPWLRAAGRHGCAWSLVIRTSSHPSRPTGFTPPVPRPDPLWPLASGHCASGSRAARLGPSPSGASPSRRPIWGRPKGPPLFLGPGPPGAHPQREYGWPYRGPYKGPIASTRPRRTWPTPLPLAPGACAVAICEYRRPWAKSKPEPQAFADWRTSGILLTIIKPI